jgi:hypothetical protein
MHKSNSETRHVKDIIKVNKNGVGYERLEAAGYMRPAASVRQRLD